MEGLLSFLVIGALFYLMMRFGCGAHAIHGHGAGAEHDGQGPPDRLDADPVCGMQVAADQGYSKMHGGRWYRFCSRKCLDKFDQDPGRYLNRERAQEEDHP